MTKYFILLTMLSYTVNSCSQNKTNMLCQKWTLIKSVDPYQGGTENLRDSTNWKSIEFIKNGDYKESDPWNKVIGVWKFNEDESKFGIKELARNDNEITKDKIISDFRWNILELDNSHMVLGIQGIHGIVKYYYVKSP